MVGTCGASRVDDIFGLACTQQTWWVGTCSVLHLVLGAAAHSCCSPCLGQLGAYRPWDSVTIFLSQATAWELESRQPCCCIDDRKYLRQQIVLWQSIQTWRRKTEKTNWSSWARHLLDIWQSLLLLEENTWERTWLGQMGEEWEPLVHVVKQRILIQKRTCYFFVPKKNHLSASEGALLAGLFILVCSRTVTSGCYFGHRKPDGPGTRWRGRSVRTELMNHSAFPQEQLRMLKYRNPRSWRSPTASRVAVSGAMCVGQSLVLSCWINHN